MADKTTKIIEIEVELEGGEKVTKQFEKLSDGTLKAADSAQKLDAKFEDVYKGIEPLTTRMGEAEDRLYELALAGDTTSKEYQELLTSVGQYRKVQIQTDLAVDSAATTLGQKLGGALTGATSGFAAVQGVMGLVGGESEQLEAALLKVQSALAIQQGVQGIKEAIPSFRMLGKTAITALKGIKTGIAATGIGVLLVAVGAIVAYWEDITELLGINNKSLEEQLELEKQIADEKSKQRSEMEETIKNNNNFIKRRIEIRKLEEDIKDLSIDQEKNQDEIFEKQKKILDLKEFQIGVELNSLEGLLSKEEKINKEIELAVIGREKRRLIAQREFDLAQEAEKKRKESAAKKKTDEEAEIARQKELAELERQRLENIENLKNELLDKIATIEQENFERTLTEQEKEVRAVEEKYFRLIELAKQNGLDTNELEIGRLNELNDINLVYAEKQKAIDEEVAANKKALDAEEIAANKEVLDKRLQMTNDAFGAISGLVTALAKDNEKSQEKAFKINKAISIAQAVINTAGAITAAINPAVGGLGIPAGLPGAALAAATGIAQVATIAKTKFEGGGGGGVDAPATSVEAQAPSFNVVGDSGVNQLAQLQQQPTQAFVVSGEVTTAQALDRNRVQNATL